ncbi:hypothetical protein ACIA8K_10605 [Catenuloplanes sp. NPDC051500]
MDLRSSGIVAICHRGRHDPATPILAVSLQRRMPGYRTLGFTKP